MALCHFSSTAVDTVVNGQVLDQLIAGLTSPDIRRELLKEAKLTLAGDVSKAVALETSITDNSLYERPHLGTTGASSGAVNKISRQNPTGRGNIVKCKYCGHQHTKERQHCPAADTRCSYCKKMGQFAAVCLQRKTTHCAQVVTDKFPSGDPQEETNRVYDTVYVAGEPQQAEAFRNTLR